MENWVDGKLKTKIEMRISAIRVTFQPLNGVCVCMCVCICVCGGVGGYMCKKPSRTAGEGEQYSAGSRLHFLHSYNIGREGHIKLS